MHVGYPEALSTCCVDHCSFDLGNLVFPLTCDPEEECPPFPEHLCAQNTSKQALPECSVSVGSITGRVARFKVGGDRSLLQCYDL